MTETVPLLPPPISPEVATLALFETYAYFPLGVIATAVGEFPTVIVVVNVFVAVSITETSPMALLPKISSFVT